MSVCTLHTQATTAHFKQYQLQTVSNARALAKALNDLGYKIVTGGTDVHLFLVDLRSKVSKQQGNMQYCNVVPVYPPRTLWEPLFDLMVGVSKCIEK